MTLGEGKERVYMLLDEYGDGSNIDEELETKMPRFFDMAQKEIAQRQPIVRICTVEREEGVTEYEMPEDFRVLRRVYADGVRTRRYRWKAGKLIIPERDQSVVEVEYSATPESITEDTDDEHEFDVSEEAAAAMPFFVAAMSLAADLVQNGDRLKEMYSMMIANLDTTERGGVQVQQTFYKGWR